MKNTEIKNNLVDEAVTMINMFSTLKNRIGLLTFRMIGDKVIENYFLKLKQSNKYTKEELLTIVDLIEEIQSN